MTELKYEPVRHDHKAFLEKSVEASWVPKKPMEPLRWNMRSHAKMLSARTRAGLTQEAVAARMATTKSAISRLEAAGQAHTFRGFA